MDKPSLGSKKEYLYPYVTIVFVCFLFFFVCLFRLLYMNVEYSYLILQIILYLLKV